MTMTHYPNGYGRRDPAPECREHDGTVECPCCKGAGEHEYGAGMDADHATCRVCEGWGYLITSVPTKRAAESVGIGK